MKKYCFFNGKIIEEHKAKLGIDDIGILRAYACFDYLRTYNGKPFLFDEHWQRFQNSAKSLGLKIPISKQKAKKIIYALLAKNKFKESNIRIVITGGKIINGIDFDKAHPTFYIINDKMHQLSNSFYKKGVKLITCDHQRENHEFKTVNYINAVKLKKEFDSKKINDILYISNNKILEISSGNFFLIKNNKLITAQNNILKGATRNLTIKLARKYFKIEERDVRLKELNSADETFITSTNRGIMPVVKIDNQKIGNGEVGEKTKHLMQIFEDYTNNY